jgi:Mg-chelatase subunit ChlD
MKYKLFKGIFVGCLVSLLVAQVFSQPPNNTPKKPNLAQLVSKISNEQTPISYGIVIDTSANMQATLPTAIKIAKNLVGQSKIMDEFFIVDMKNSSNIELLKDFNSKLELSSNILDNVTANRSSSLLDGIIVSGEYLQSGKNKQKVLIVLSDGIDDNSTYTIDQTINKLKSYQIQLCFIKLTPAKDKKSGTEIEKKASKLITKLTNGVGGIEYSVSDPKDIDLLAQKVFTDLRQ